MTWQKNTKDSTINQKYYMVNGNKTVCKVVLNGVTHYELWINGQYAKSAKSFDEVVKWCMDNEPKREVE
jgi:predicted SprT family Zn-dependent metalloprotease